MNLDFTDYAILKGAADAIRTHNYIHNRAERNAVLITVYLDFAANLIDKFADGDVVVARHGHWIEPTEETIGKYRDDGCVAYYTCSCCKEISKTDYDFCPNCGARMDATDTNFDVNVTTNKEKKNEDYC